MEDDEFEGAGPRRNAKQVSLRMCGVGLASDNQLFSPSSAIQPPALVLLAPSRELSHSRPRTRPPFQQLSPEEQAVAFVRTIGEIVSTAIALYEQGKAINVEALKTRIGQKHNCGRTPRLVEIIAAIPEQYKAKLKDAFMARPIRSASGIAVVAVMSKPHRCPHIAMTGNICVYCPGGPDSDFEYSTQSYTGYEPTSMRAIRARYDPYKQAKNRVDQLKRLGHSVDKVEYILMGGTFMSLPEDYRDYFVRNLHDALSGHRSRTVAEAVRFSEQSKSRCIGLTIETRPDYCQRRHLHEMLSYGCTRLELGVQSVYEDVARDTNRGHTVSPDRRAGVKRAGGGVSPCLEVVFARVCPTIVTAVPQSNFRPPIPASRRASIIPPGPLGLRVIQDGQGRGLQDHRAHDARLAQHGTRARSGAVSGVLR